ncbi:MAG TPA: hypothetical protein DDY52_03270 [Candidatus Moranbacteria bacterium]|nr:hypothetical protein [Candidatus Moranbacteria bacterium]
MLISELLKKIHREYAKDTSYPEGSDNEEMLVRLDYVDDAIDEYESCVDEGYCWDELKTKLTFIFGGTGTDELPETFLSFIKKFGQKGFEKAQFLIGNVTYSEIDASEGVELEQQGQTSGNVFWQEGDNIRTLPAIAGTYILPCLEKHPRYVTGEELTPIKMKKPKFIQYFVVAKLFLDDEDESLYEANMLAANEELKKMRYKQLA